MPATTDEQSYFRRKLDGTETSMPDEYIDELFDEVEAVYSGYSRTVIVQAALISGMDDLIIKATKLTDYTQNQSSEKRSQVIAALERVRARYVAKLDELVKKEQGPAVRWGGMVKVPRRRREYPDA